MDKRWNVLSADETKVSSLQEHLRIHKSICKILVQRGIEDFDAARNYFRPQLEHLHDPFLMKDMQIAVNRILEAINQNQKILIFGDYDVDGTTSIALLYRFLTSVYDAQNIDYYVPHRYREGYGVSILGIEYAAENNVDLIISIDCGIKAIEPIEYAAELGMDFIVCDHHLPDKTLPPAIAILNPKQTDCSYPYKELCGCGIGFKLITAIAQILKIPASDYLKYLDLVVTAIGADIVPITGENRIMAFYGLKLLNENPCAGIQALKELSGTQTVFSIQNVVFMIAPRVNAAGRMDDAKKAVQLFIEEDVVNAKALAELLHSDNQDRKDADSATTEEALAMIEKEPFLATKMSTVLFQPHWHKGVVGIVASRVMEHHYKPTVILTQGKSSVSGSARSVPGFNLYEAIHACREFLTGYGGHFAAAGVTMPFENVEAFIEKFEQVVKATINPHLLIPELLIDDEIVFETIREPFYNILCQMQPFGPENMRPVFVSRKVQSTVGTKIVKDQHIRFVLKQGHHTFTGIGFNLSHKFGEISQNDLLDVVYTIDKNEWNGNSMLQLKIIDFKKSDGVLSK